MALPFPRMLLTASAFLAAGAWLSCGAAFASEPFKDWEVGPIHAQSSNGVGYCSMKNFYERGQALVFARDAEGSSSFAISFPDKMLVSGGQYTAGLRIGSMTRHAVGLAGTPSVLIVQLGFDRDVYKALQREQNLSVTIKDKTFSFSLDGTKEALEVLMDCANTLAKGKTFEPVTVTAVEQVLGDGVVVSPDPAPSLGREVAEKTLLDEIDRLRLENRKLLRENQIAMAKLLESGELDAVPGIDLEEEIARQKQEEALERSRKLVAANKSLHKRQAAAPVLEGVLLPDIEPAAGNPAPAPQRRTETARVQPMAASYPPDAVIVVHKEESFLDRLMKKTRIGASAVSGRYSWEGEGLYGAAEERPLPGGGLRAAVSAYIEEVRGRCPGDFAHNIGALHKAAGYEALEGELACLDGKNDAAAAVAFVAGRDKFAIITHEGATDAMEAALVRRDGVISNISR